MRPLEADMKEKMPSMARRPVGGRGEEEVRTAGMRDEGETSSYELAEGARDSVIGHLKFKTSPHCRFCVA
jgi:hypothetical protein